MDFKNKKYLLLLLVICLNFVVLSAQDCEGAAISTNESFLYGRFETVMQSAAGSGIVSSFFLFNIETNCNWPAENNEIDVEMTGNNQQIYFTTHHPHPTQAWHFGENFFLNFNPHTSFHKYVIEWEPGIVRWFVDDQLIYTQDGDTSDNLHYPMAILMNLWAAEAESWVGEWDNSILPRQSMYEYVKYYSYTPGEGNIGTGNNFTFDWEDDFETLDTDRWKVSDFTGFGGNYCRFRENNVQVVDNQLTLKIDLPQSDFELTSVSFSVNVSDLNLSSTDRVYLNGRFNNWRGTCAPMTKNGDVWELDLNLPPGRHEYLFTINGWDEIGNAPIGSECDFNPCDEFANYGLTISNGDADIILETTCWEDCDNCFLTSNTTPTTNVRERSVVKIFNLLGEEVEVEKPGQVLIYLYDDMTVEKKIILN